MKKKIIRHAPQQSRSQQRLDLILDTAADLFARVGYETATTNAIAERAGISIGSLYRYFPDKDAILRALAKRYWERIKNLHEEVFTVDLAAIPLPSALDRIIDPFLEMYIEFPIYAHILLGADVSADIAAASQAMEREIIESLADMFHRAAPNLTERRARTAAIVCKAAVKGLISLITSTRDENFRTQITVEFKSMLAAYLERVFADGKNPYIPTRSALHES